MNLGEETGWQSMNGWQSDVIERNEGFMEKLSENIASFELWHAAIESSWVDLERLKGCEVLSISTIHTTL